MVNLLKNKDTNLRDSAVSFHCSYLCIFKTTGTYDGLVFWETRKMPVILRFRYCRKCDVCKETIYVIWIAVNVSSVITGLNFEARNETKLLDKSSALARKI